MGETRRILINMKEAEIARGFSKRSGARVIQIPNEMKRRAQRTRELTLHRKHSGVFFLRACRKLIRKKIKATFNTELLFGKINNTRRSGWMQKSPYSLLLTQWNIFGFTSKRVCTSTKCEPPRNSQRSSGVLQGHLLPHSDGHS